MIKLARNGHRYYLAIEDDIIDFDRISGFPDMTSFIMLILFSAMFENKDKLIEGLKGLGLVNGDFAPDTYISIVKASRDKKRQDSYDTVTSNFLYRGDESLLGVKSVNSFVLDNRSNYRIMSEFFGSYLEENTSMAEYFLEKTKFLQFEVERSTGQEKRELQQELEKRKNSLNNFNAMVANLKKLLDIIKSLESGSIDASLNSQYCDRLYYFIKSEIYYRVGRGDKWAMNYRGLVKLATRIRDFLKRYPELKRPATSTDFVNNRYTLLTSYKKAVELKKEGANSSIIANNWSNDGDEEPDSYMFLDSDDYERLKRSSSQPQDESIEADLENLHEKKGQFGK